MATINIDLSLLPMTYGMVGMLLRIKLPGNTNVYRQLRLMSTMIYLIHMLVIVVLEHTMSDADTLQLFIYISCITLAISLLLSQLIKVKHFMWIKQLF